MTGLNYLIADATSARTTIRQLLAQWKVPATRVSSIESPGLARDALHAANPNVAIVDSSMLEQGGREMLSLFESARQADAGPRAFILLAQKGSNAWIEALLDDRIDAVITKPFTQQQLSDQLTEAIRSKTQPDPYQKALEVGRSFRRVGKGEKASQVFGLAEKLNPAPALACWHQGDIAREIGDLDTALSHFKRGVAFQKDHVRCLEGALECCLALGHDAAALMIAQFLFDRRAFPLRHVVKWAEAALKLRHHDRFLKMYEYIEELGSLNAGIAKPLFSGMLELMKEAAAAEDDRTATLALRRAEVCTRGDNELIKKLLSTVLTAGMIDEARGMMARVGSEVMQSPEVRVAELWAMGQGEASMDLLQRALDMINSGIRTIELFKFAIDKSRELNRRPDLIDELLHQAHRAFPDVPEFAETP